MKCPQPPANEPQKSRSGRWQLMRANARDGKKQKCMTSLQMGGAVADIFLRPDIVIWLSIWILLIATLLSRQSMQSNRELLLS